MINWNFREKIIYHEEEITQDSRKFEILVEAYYNGSVVKTKI